MKTKKVEFVNAKDMAKQYPESFGLPSKKELDSIKPGINIKVSTGGERFWVLTTEKCDEGFFTGTVNNDLIETEEHGLMDKDKILFHRDNVYDVFTLNE